MTSRRPTLGAILGIFVLSGAAGLVYEIVWARQLVLVFGNTTQAVSAILTGFFGGMAIGAWVGGRLADRVRSPIRWYGYIELVLVVVVLLTPVTFRLIHELYRGIYPALVDTPLLSLVRLGLSLLALGPATILMGATLPTLTRQLAKEFDLSLAFGRLYAANTLGAILGTLVAGVILIELFGLTGALVVGAGCSGVAGVMALLIDRRLTRSGGVESGAGAPAPVPVAFAVPLPARPRLALAVAFVSGLTSLGYQVLWTRLLASGTGNTSYVFTVILALFLIGIALGAVLFNLIRPRLRDPLRLLAAAQVLVAALVILGLVGVLGRPENIDPARGLDTLQTLMGATLLVVLPVTVVLGLAFPAASALLGDDGERAGTSPGTLVAVNTVGAIAGSFLVPFLLVPAIGSPNAVAVLALVNVAVALALSFAVAGAGRRSRALLRVPAVAVALVVAVAAVTPGALAHPNEAWIVGVGGRVFQSEEDEITSVQAGLARSSPELWVAGTSMTLLTVDARLMPILPLMARPDATEALIVAFGMGSSYRSSLAAGLRTDAVELVPSVPKMFGWFFPDADEVLADPNGRIIIADGRNHLELTDSRYDIIVTDPPPPLESSGASVISSYEYYLAGRARLKPAGVMVQWLPDGSSPDEYRAHLRSFAAVFPEMLVLRSPGEFGHFLMGSSAPVVLAPEGIRRALERPGVLEDISGAFDSPADDIDGWIEVVEEAIVMPGVRIHDWVGPGPMITDDRPLPEYFLLRRAFERTL